MSTIHTVTNTRTYCEYAQTCHQQNGLLCHRDRHGSDVTFNIRNCTKHRTFIAVLLMRLCERYGPAADHNKWHFVPQFGHTPLLQCLLFNYATRDAGSTWQSIGMPIFRSLSLTRIDVCVILVILCCALRRQRRFCRPDGGFYCTWNMNKITI